MKFYYKRIEIIVDGRGFFVFKFGFKEYSYGTLDEAKREIDSLSSRFYKFSVDDYENLLSKLNDRERFFVSDMVEELKYWRDFKKIRFDVNFQELNED